MLKGALRAPEDALRAPLPLEVDSLDPIEIWDIEAAKSYDTPGVGMFSPEVLEPTVDRLAGYAQNGRALEFGIGTGRVAVPLSQRGIQVAGIDSSPAMVSQLRTKANEDEIPVVIGDMATARVDGKFSLVFCVYNTISNLLTQAEQVACFKNAARHLLPGGRFVIELWVPELRKLLPGQSSVLWRTDADYIGYDNYDVVNQRVVSTHVTLGKDKSAKVFQSPHRYIWPAELDLMGELAGFRLEDRFSDWLGNPFTAESASHVSVYRLME